MSDSLFDYVNSITHVKDDIIIDKESEKNYNSFMVNRALSLYTDTILYAQEMNQASHLDNKLQYDYLRHSIRKSKRFAKWPKKQKIEDIELIRKYYKYSYSNAKIAYSILSEKQLELIRESFEQGGTK